MAGSDLSILSICKYSTCDSIFLSRFSRYRRLEEVTILEVILYKKSFDSPSFSRPHYTPSGVHSSFILSVSTCTSSLTCRFTVLSSTLHQHKWAKEEMHTVFLLRAIEYSNARFSDQDPVQLGYCFRIQESLMVPKKKKKWKRKNLLV